MDPDVVLVDLPDERVRSVRRRLSPAELPGFARAHLDGSSGTPYLVRHAPVTPEAGGDVEACSPDPAGELRAGGRCVALTVRGPAPLLLPAYERLAAHARATGLELAGPPRERYLADGAVQVAWPVEEPQTGG